MPVPMSPNDAPNANNKGFNWGRFSKTLSFWVLVILIPVALIQLSGLAAESAPEINYTQYEPAARSATTSSDVTMPGREDVTGDVQAAAVVGQQRRAKRFTPAAAGGELAGRDRAADARRACTITAHGRASRTSVSVRRQLPAVAAAHRLLDLPLPADAGGRREGVLVRQVEGEAAHRRHAQGDVRRRRRRRRGEGQSCRRSSSS